MATQLQLRRGTDAQNDAFTGAQGEVTVDTTNDRLRVHDGATQGGFPIAKVSDIKDMTLYSYATNCITEIPQDIQLTLSSGTLTLKAGSKIYVPNGAGNFATRNITENKTLTDTSGVDNKWLVAVSSAGGLLYRALSNCTSGANATASSGFAYDTTTNDIGWFTANGTKSYSNVSFPVCICSSSSSGFTSIDQVFNGFGYIGSTVFALPGVKALKPNGRNADGTLCNVVDNNTSVIVTTKTTNDEYSVMLGGGYLSVAPTRFAYSYNEKENYVYWYGNRSTSYRAATMVVSGGKITSLDVKTPFHAVDYNDFIEELDKKADVATSANTSLSNLTSTGANIGNWSSNVTNCITEIPQDINLTLSNGTLTLKAGSKVYRPNGVGNFDIINITTDKTTTPTANGTYFYFINESGNLQRWAVADCLSGTTSPAPTVSRYPVWYDTANNIIKRSDDYGSTWSTDSFSFPLCIVTVSGGIATSVDQVFNGFGYIGSTVFVLPGVKGLIPDGINADGTLKNITGVISAVRTQDMSPVISNNRIIALSGAGNLNRYQSLETNNNNYNIANGSAVVQDVGFCKAYTDSNGKITSFIPEKTFRSLDYNDSNYIANCAMPSNRYTDLTLGNDNDPLTAPTDGYYVLSKTSGATGERIGFQGRVDTFVYSSDSGQGLAVYMPVRKGDTVSVRFTATGATNRFRFIYANGAK